LWWEMPPVGGSPPNRFERFTASIRFERFHLFQASGFAGGRWLLAKSVCLSLVVTPFLQSHSSLLSAEWIREEGDIRQAIR
jgi:hypothetical protein